MRRKAQDHQTYGLSANALRLYYSTLTTPTTTLLLLLPLLLLPLLLQRQLLLLLLVRERADHQLWEYTQGPFNAIIWPYTPE